MRMEPELMAEIYYVKWIKNYYYIVVVDNHLSGGAQYELGFFGRYFNVYFMQNGKMY